MLAEALIRNVGGFDEEGLATLHEADRLASADGRNEQVALARTELGFVDYLRGRYDRALLSLGDAVAQGADSPSIVAKATTYLGAVESDRASYPAARRHLSAAIRLARVAQQPRTQAYAQAALGRLELFDR